MSNYKKLVFSGVQPTGNLHLGNFLEALKKFVSLQKEMNCIYCVVDLHAITIFQDPKKLKENVLETTAGFLATGLDPNKSIIFNQSSVSGHAELAWILNCVSRLGWLNRMTQFKDKAGSDKEKASVGLYVYPNLMAADILLYKATHVPVGADQKQHLELCRDIAQKFNTLPIPDNEADLKKRSEALNLLNIYGDLTNTSLTEVLKEMKGKEFSFFKKKLSDVVVEVVCPVGENMKKLMKEKSHLDAILQKGKEKASNIAEENLKKIRSIVGLI